MLAQAYMLAQGVFRLFEGGIHLMRRSRFTLSDGCARMEWLSEEENQRSRRRRPGKEKGRQTLGEAPAGNWTAGGPGPLVKTKEETEESTMNYEPEPTS